MRTLSARATLAVVALAGPLGAAGWLEAPAAAASNPRPATIPAVREWSGGEGSFQLRRSSRIVVPARYRARLRSTASLFAADLRELTGRRLPIATRRGNRARPGDLRLSLGAREGRLGEEGYRLSIGRATRITANSPAGAFYGTRTVLQLLKQRPSLPRGSARDWPRYPERGLMVDIGRKYFTPRWLAARIRELAWLKLNYLHLHFTENLGWRIESQRHPEVVSPQHLSRQELAEIVALAKRHRIAVVPEIDMPGHMGAALARHPELQLKDAFGQPNPTNLDYTLAEGRRFARELVEEYLPLFPGPYFHVGADEYLFLGPVPLVHTPLDYTAYPHLEAYARQEHGPEATVKDGILGFLNSIDRLVRDHGKALRVWNDGLGGGRAVTLNREVVVDWWRDSEGADPADLLAQGRRIMNAGWYPTYYVNGPTGNVPPRPDVGEAYESWQPNVFRGPFYVNGAIGASPQVISPEEPRNLGSKLHVWNDDPAAATEGEIAAGIYPRLRLISQKTWGSPPLTPRYAEFERIMHAVGGAPGAPG